MASSSCVKQSPVPVKEPLMKYAQYPTPEVRYEDVVADPKLFRSTLEKLHATMGTKFMIPVIGGRELDLHRLFVEVTSRGGIEKIIKERKWKEVTASFNFPSTATNASFVLRKYYGTLLYHYEQIYFFKAQGWTSEPSASMQSPPVSCFPAQVLVQPSREYQAARIQQQKTNSADLCGATSAGPSVIGVIDGKFESGYLVTVTIGSEKFKGVLYQSSQNQLLQVPHHNSIPINNSGNAQVIPRIPPRRRRRRKKCEIKRRDPAHPKPNRSGYNFFFAEQHARLKPLYLGKDREISRMIGELWNNLKEPEKSIYQEKAAKDKERYRMEMEDYRERLRTGRVISIAVPLQQWVPEEDVDMVDVDLKTEETGGDSPPENESSSGETDSEDKNKTPDKELDVEADPNAGCDIAMETLPRAFGTSKNAENAGDAMAEKDGEENMKSTVVESNTDTPGIHL